jgi:ElaB/YqjD/DUF883 family membrane-anchored ribosome-binding protein
MKANEINTEKLVADLQGITTDAEELLRALGGETDEKARALRARLTAALESAKQTYHRLEEKAVAGAKATDKVIRAHPYESIGVAFGVGLLVGVLVTRK